MSGLNLDRMPGANEEDSPHVDKDRGLFVLAVANHTEGALHSADGDYAALQVDSSGRLRIVGDLDVVSDVADDSPDTENPLKVGSRSRFGAVLPAISDTNDKADLISDEYRRLYINDSFQVGLAGRASSIDDTLGGTALQSGASVLSGRRFLMIQNRGNTGSIFVGPTGVTEATGIEIDKRSTLSLQIGEEVSLFGIAEATKTEDVRILAAA